MNNYKGAIIEESCENNIINIRLIGDEDIKILGEIYSRVYEVFDIGEKWTPNTASKLIEYWFKKQPDLAFLAEYKGKVVGGFLSGIKPWWDGNHLFDGEIFVHPNFQNKKIGKTLFRKLLNEAIAKYDAKIFDAFTFNGSEFPLNWYKRIGFKKY